ncbi:hypothetical protein N7516_000962 [Penicillium verrucosum]|uniref:uncharacterized protein n=1 Tax=Penicillium verrucosum TaxID=60171 RepID=UPI002545B5CE|nr:uncharacterized protein N7516_000962 [Penicillium verrucosum]KAJ5940794.1 hypothetical protein N7516_000962 [Penicillium verrucosum]
MMLTSFLSRRITQGRVPARHLSTYASFYYLENLPLYQTTKPYHINIPHWALPPGQQCNEVSVPYTGISVTGIRSRQDEFKLDVQGFQVAHEEIRGPNSLFDCISLEEYYDMQKVKTHVIPAVQSFLKRKIQGAEAVLPISSQIRRRDAQFPTLPRGTDAMTPQPVQGVHVDFTPDSIRAEIQDTLAEGGYSDLSGRRWQVLSVWRPLFGPLRDWPLAMLDYRSLDKENDLVASDNIYTHAIRETYNVLYNESHKWYYLEDQRPDEVLIFKTFDSLATKGNARGN